MLRALFKPRSRSVRSWVPRSRRRRRASATRWPRQSRTPRQDQGPADRIPAPDVRRRGCRLRRRASSPTPRCSACPRSGRCGWPPSVVAGVLINRLVDHPRVGLRRCRLNSDLRPEGGSSPPIRTVQPGPRLARPALPSRFARARLEFEEPSSLILPSPPSPYPPPGPFCPGDDDALARAQMSPHELCAQQSLAARAAPSDRRATINGQFAVSVTTSPSGFPPSARHTA